MGAWRPGVTCDKRGRELLIVLNFWYTKFDFTVDERKEWLNPSREKIKARTAERRWMRNPVRPSCVTPAGTSNELDVRNEWEENTHTH